MKCIIAIKHANHVNVEFLLALETVGPSGNAGVLSVNTFRHVRPISGALRVVFLKVL
jgi:hypothetical protein